MEGTTVGDLLQEQPTNYAYKPGYISATDKSWAKKYEPITAVIIHSRREADGSVWANFDGRFLPEFADDELRKSQPANRPNTRQWRLDTEADGESWFHNEVSNVVLAAWAEYPSILQTSHAKPLSEEAIPEVVDTTYSIKRKPLRLPMLIGEMKRNLIREDEWGRGKIESKSQVKLSQELRGYADKYECPRVFCFDMDNLLILQFRAARQKEIKDPKCAVDCWVIPRLLTGGTTLRYAVYRLLLQGYRRCQSSWSVPVSLGGMIPHSHEFFSGRPIWKLPSGRLQLNHPGGYNRAVDASSGAFFFGDGADPARDDHGNVAWHTEPFWTLSAQQAQAAIQLTEAGGDVDDFLGDIYTAN